MLAHFNGLMSDVYSLTHYTTDIDAFMRSGNVRQTFFAPPYPITTTVQVVRLYDPALLIEITASAEIPAERFRDPARARRWACCKDAMDSTQLVHYRLPFQSVSGGA